MQPQYDCKKYQIDRPPSSLLNIYSKLLDFLMQKCGFVSTEDRPAVTCEEMRRREQSGIAIGITRLMMMENAGNAIARFLRENFHSKTKVLIIAGYGNNGGDAFAAARQLSYWDDFEITLALIGNETNIRSEEAMTNWKILREIKKVKIAFVDTIENAASLNNLVGACNVIVLAIFGTGFRGKPRDLQANVIEIANRSKALRISVDIPSGMEGDSGNYEIAGMSNYTITMDSPKIGMLANERSREACGKILVANIGLPS